MGSRIVYFCDVHGIHTEASATGVPLVYADKAVELDLCDDCVSTIAAAVSPVLAVGRAPNGTGRRKPRTRKAAVAAPPADDTAVVYRTPGKRGRPDTWHCPHTGCDKAVHSAAGMRYHLVNEHDDSSTRISVRVAEEVSA